MLPCWQLPLRSAGAVLVLLGCNASIESSQPPAAGIAGGAGGTVGAGVGGSGSGAGGSAAGASGRIIEPTPCEPTLDSIQRVIVGASCADDNCHGSVSPAVRLSLTVDDLEPVLVNVTSSTCAGWSLVVPGSPEQSYLYQKVTQSMLPCDGDRMPLDAVLPANQVECIADWITSLAPSGCEMCGGSSCVSLASDPSNCGACDNACPAGTTCENGICACPGGLLACGGACVDTTTDPTHCGACGVACPAGAGCAEGACRCSGSLTSCGSACVDLQSNPAACGACGTACDAGEVCLNGTCSSGCSGLTQCGAACADVSTSAVHCGACDMPCDAPRSCTGGVCACASGQTWCTNSCVDTLTDASNCGACGASCGPGSTCSGGRCACGATTVSFASDVQPIWSANCVDAGCHTGARPKDNLSLDPGAAFAELVGVPTDQCNGQRTLVVPGDVGASYLMNKLLGTDLCTGSQMPKAGQSLSSADLATINTWICQGAPNN